MKFKFIVIFVTCFNLKAADCPEFETTLQSLISKISSKKEEREAFVKKQKLSGSEVKSFKTRYQEELHLPVDSNRKFMQAMESDKSSLRNPRPIYFDVENSIQKKMNDQIFGEKTMVDAVNNAFLKRFKANLKDEPELRSFLTHEYKDYKSLRMRFQPHSEKDIQFIGKKLDEIYKKSVDDFSSEIKDLKIPELYATRTDDAAHPERWFLSGRGETALQANMAAREARSADPLVSRAISFSERAVPLVKKIEFIESKRLSIEKAADLLQVDLLMKLDNGKKIPSKEMISLFRKYKVSDFKSEEAYLKAMKEKIKKLKGVDVSDSSLKLLGDYQKEIDSLSPPLFSRERVQIDLAKAHEGIVSVDFTGVGVDNLFMQMKALASMPKVNVKDVSQLNNAFELIQKHVDLVTEEMNKAKRTFSNTVEKMKPQSSKPLFSGDDGIFMPDSAWNPSEKNVFLKSLSSINPDNNSKYRITFVPTKFSNGSTIPHNLRSSLIVRAETAEKGLRDQLVGVGKLSLDKSKKLITAVDYSPNSSGGGEFRVIASGVKLTKEEKAILEKAVKDQFSQGSNETFAGIVYLD